MEHEAHQEHEDICSTLSPPVAADRAVLIEPRRCKERGGIVLLNLRLRRSFLFSPLIARISQMLLTGLDGWTMSAPNVQFFWFPAECEDWK